MIKIKKLKLFEMLFWLSMITAFTGTAFLTFPLGPFHIFPFRVSILLLWFFWLLICVKNRSFPRIKVTYFFAFLFLWLLYAVLSIIWSADKISSVKHVIFLFLNVSVIFFIVYYLKQFNRLQKFLKLWVIVYVLILPIGFWEVFTGNHLSNSGLLNTDEGYDFYRFAPTTLFANQNDYATLIALTMPMFYTSIRHCNLFYWRIFYFLVCILSILMLMFTTSRANYLGVLLAFLFWYLFMLDRKEKVRVLLTTFSVVALIVILISEKNTEFLKMIWDDFSTIISAQNNDSGLDVRSNLIKNGIKFSINSFGFGVGAGNVEFYMENKPIYFVGNITNVHNWWIELLANYGIWIFTSYFIYYLALIILLFKAYYILENSKEKAVCESLICGLISFSISSFSSSSVMSFLPHWMFFGVSLAFVNYILVQNISGKSKTMHTSVYN
jgi:teichuronic acid biosynthesis protein TuaE